MHKTISLVVALGLIVVRGDPIPRVPHGPQKVQYRDEDNHAYPFHFDQYRQISSKKGTTAAVQTFQTAPTSVSLDPTVTLSSYAGSYSLDTVVSSSSESVDDCDPALSSLSSSAPAQNGYSLPTASNIYGTKSFVTSTPSASSISTGVLTGSYGVSSTNASSGYPTAVGSSYISGSKDPSSQPSATRGSYNGTLPTVTGTFKSTSISIHASGGYANVTKSYALPNSTLAVVPTGTAYPSVAVSSERISGEPTYLSSTSKSYALPNDTATYPVITASGTSAGAGTGVTGYPTNSVSGRFITLDITSRFDVTITLSTGTGTAAADPTISSSSAQYSLPGYGGDPKPTKSLVLTTVRRPSYTPLGSVENASASVNATVATSTPSVIVGNATATTVSETGTLIPLASTKSADPSTSASSSVAVGVPYDVIFTTLMTRAKPASVIGSRTPLAPTVSQGTGPVKTSLPYSHDHHKYGKHRKANNEEKHRFLDLFRLWLYGREHHHEY